MFSVALLDLPDDQIDLVLNSVRNWCADHGHDINGQRGRDAMQMAISLAVGNTRDVNTFADDLERNLAANEQANSTQH